MTSQTKINEALNYCGIDPNDPHKQLAYYHASRFLELVIRFDGQNCKQILSKARLYVGVDERYINQYYCSFLEWGVIALKGNSIVYIGIPDGIPEDVKQNIPEPQESKILKSSKKELLKKASKEIYDKRDEWKERIDNGGIPFADIQKLEPFCTFGFTADEFETWFLLQIDE